MRRLFPLSLFLLVVATIVLPTLIGRNVGRPTAQHPGDGADQLTINVYFPDTRKIIEMPLGEYLKGVVAAEMPAEFADEALKAQFVVARTYAAKRMQRLNGSGRGGCPLEPMADVCADHQTGQAFISREDAARKHGANAGMLLWKRLDQAQAETAGLVLVHSGQLIDPLYHSVSGTMTEEAGEYFTRSLPYLQPVDDFWGRYSPKMYETRRFAPMQLARLLSVEGAAVPAAKLVGLTRHGRVPVEITAKTTTGRVKTVKVGDQVLTGREFRTRLGLRSTNFSVSLEGDDIIVKTVGYGHGVGMSQYGANGMAQRGKGYQEILHYYYKDVQIQRLFEE